MIDLIPNPGDAELEAILAPLAAHNDAAAGPTERHKVALVLRDDAGTAIGGLWAEASYRWTKPRLWRTAVELQAAGVLNLAPLVTHRAPFADAPALFERLAAGEPGLLQAVLEFRC